MLSEPSFGGSVGFALDISPNLSRVSFYVIMKGNFYCLLIHRRRLKYKLGDSVMVVRLLHTRDSVVERMADFGKANYSNCDGFDDA